MFRRAATERTVRIPCCISVPFLPPQSGKWPLVVDVSQQASVFLRYLDSNYVNACSATHMQRDKLRKSLLGAIRCEKRERKRQIAWLSWFRTLHTDHATPPNPARVRRSYGKPFVVDFMAVDLCDEFLRALDEVQPNLAEDVLSRGIAKARERSPARAGRRGRSPSSFLCAVGSTSWRASL